MNDKGKKQKGMIAMLANKLKANKKLEYAVYIIIAALIIAIYLSSLLPSKKEKETGAQAVEIVQAGELDMEKRLSEVLSNIRGAGCVEVMITYDTGPELVPAMSMDSNINRTETVGDGKRSNTENQVESTKPATLSGSGGTSPIILTEKQPEVRGVIVIAEGAGNIMVRMDLMKAVQTVLQVPIANIEVFEKEAQDLR